MPLPASATVGRVKVKRASRPGPSLSARMPAPVGLHYTLADGQPQPRVPGLLLGTHIGELAEQQGQALRRDAPALVRHREGHVNAVPLGAHPYD